MMFGELLICALLLCSAQATSNGADPQACSKSNMNPSGHTGATASSDPSPYSIEVDGTQYAGGGSLTVTLMGSQSFKGFLILALPNSDDQGTPIGNFEVADSADSDLVKDLCNGGLTHVLKFKNAIRDKIVLKWNAPATVAGDVRFYVTFVEAFSMFWVKRSSIPIWDGVGTRPVTTETSAITDPPQISAVSRTGCKENKGCYSDCQDGENKCGFLLTWTKKSNSLVEFELFGSLEDDENYVALGLSTKPQMSDVSIIGCTADTRRRCDVEQFYANNRSVPSYVAEPLLLVDVDASIQTEAAPRTMSCRFTYDNAKAKSDKTGKWKDLNEPLFAFIARGPGGPASLQKHTKRPKISAMKLSFLSGDNVEIRGNYIAGLVKAHACIMILAWVFCASVGLILARYYKPMWEDTKACGEKVWFSYHRALMLSAMFLTVIGFVCILVYKEGMYSVDHLTLPHKAHPILGLIAIICALLNPLIAAFRCHPGDSKRPLFNWLHWFFGTVAHVFAIVAIFLGMLFESVAVPPWITYIMMAFCLFHVCVEFILEIHQCCMYDKNRDRQDEYQKSKGNGPKYAGRGFKCGMLVLYTLVVSLITVALVVIVAVWGSAAGTNS